MKNNKGQIATMVMIIGGLILAIVSVVGIWTGSFQNLLLFLFDYKWSVATLIILASLGIVIVKNVASKKPMWVRDFKGIGGIIAIMLVVIFVIPTVTGTLSKYQADVTVGVHYNGNIDTVEINNVRKSTALSIFKFNEPLGILREDYQVKATSYCKSDEGYTKTSSTMGAVSPIRFTTDSTKLTVNRLTRGSCYIDFQTMKGGNVVDQKKRYFTVG